MKRSPRSLLPILFTATLTLHGCGDRGADDALMGLKITSLFRFFPS